MYIYYMYIIIYIMYINIAKILIYLYTLEKM